MGDGIDVELISGIVSTIIAFLLIWLKSSMDNKMGEIKEDLSITNTNMNNMNINLASQAQAQAQIMTNIDNRLINAITAITQSQQQNVTVTQELRPYRLKDHITEVTQPIIVKEEEVEE